MSPIGSRGFRGRRGDAPSDRVPPGQYVTLDGIETSAEYVVQFCDGGYTTNLPLEGVTGGKAWEAEMDELMLDGNAVAGLLQEVFAVEMTTAVGTCATCGAADAVGALRVFRGVRAVSGRR